jgi:hypothetical protein
VASANEAACDRVRASTWANASTSSTSAIPLSRR